MGIFDRWRKPKGEGDRVKGDPVAFPRGTGGAGSGGAWNVTGGNLLRFLGSNVEGYDALLAPGAKGAIVPGDAGRFSDNSAVAACLNWILTSWSTTPLLVGRMEGAEFVPVEGHPLQELLARPHPEYDGNWLVANWLRDLFDHGNFYANVVTRKQEGTPLHLQYLPAHLVEPRDAADLTEAMIGHYEYRPGGAALASISPRDMLHGRVWPDPDDPRKGRSPLYACWREIYADNLASLISAAMLRRPHPSAILSPDGDVGDVTDDDLRVTKQQAEEVTSGAHSGSVLAFPTRVKWQPMSFKPSELALGEIRKTPEERVCAVLGIPPVVINLGAGLERSTYNNVDSARKSAWQDCLIPLQDFVADILTHDLMPLFEGEASDLICRYDRSQVGVLQEDRTDERKVILAEYAGGLITLDEARAELGRDPMKPSDRPKPPPALPAEEDEEEEAPSTRAFAPLRRKAAPGDDAMSRAAARYRVALARGEAQAVRSMEGHLRTAEAAIREKLASLITRMEEAAAAGEIIDAAWVEREARYRELLAQVEDAFRALSGPAGADLAAAQRAAIVEAEDASDALFRSALGPVPAGVNEQAAERAREWTILLDSEIEALAGFAGDGSPLHVLLSEIGPDAAAAVRDALISSLALGENPKDAARRVETAVGVSRARALNIARTETLRAAREATRRIYEANADVVTSWQWLSARDVRSCAACWAMDGQTFPTREPMGSHPQCRCALIPVTKSWAEITGDESLPDTRPLLGSGPESFARLSEADQLAVLGPGGFDLYAAGTPLSAFVRAVTDGQWGTTRTVRPLSEISQ